MARGQVGKAMRLVVAASGVALGAAQACAMGGAGSAGGAQNGGGQAASSPYAIIAPMAALQTSGGERRAAYQGRAPSCAFGESAIPTDFGWRCKPDW